MIRDFYDDLLEEEIHIRDRLQFEFKTDYFPVSSKKESYSRMEFFLFVPTPLGINSRTYSQEQFYQDQTTLIRFRTPELSLASLADPEAKRSPLYKIRALLKKKKVDEPEVSDELRLFGNILRSQIRNRVRALIERVHHGKQWEEEVLKFVHEVNRLRQDYLVVHKSVRNELGDESLIKHAEYVDEFFSVKIEFYFTGLLDQLLQHDADPNSAAVNELKKAIEREFLYRKDQDYVSRLLAEGQRYDSKEYFLYQRGLLKRFVLDALLLSTERTEPAKRLQPLVGMLAAGTAMLFYFVLFVLQGQWFVIESIPFILITVFLYIIKDRIKEGIKLHYAKRAVTRYPDYITHIRLPRTKTSVGLLKEAFRFMSERALPPDIVALRNKSSSSAFEEQRRRETVCYYKKEVTLDPSLLKRGGRRCDLNHIFRFNVASFIQRAADPVEMHRFFDIKTGELKEVLCPKVYHVNLVIRSTYMTRSGREKVDLRKVRIILDKDGIKRVERVD